MKPVYIFFVIFSFCFLSCSNNDEIFNMTVASMKAENYDNCYIVKSVNDLSWRLFHSPIEGFDYKEGHEYVINVTAVFIGTELQDISSFRYKLNYIISDIEKESENIPSFF